MEVTDPDVRLDPIGHGCDGPLQRLYAVLHIARHVLVPRKANVGVDDGLPSLGYPDLRSE